MTNTKDLRFVRTETAIRSAFMELLAKKPAGSITASAVCRRAGISRNAFYLHHPSIDSLYAAMVDELLSDVRAECIASAERVAASRTLDEQLIPSSIAMLQKHEALLRALLPSDDGLLAKRLANGIANAYVEVALEFSEQGGSLEHRLRCAFSAWAFLGILQRWFELTDQPIAGLLPYLSEFQAGIQADATRFLAGDDVV